MFPTRKKKSVLDQAIENAIMELDAFNASEEGYTNQVANVEKLIKMRALAQPQKVSHDTLALVAGNLLGIIVIVGHERAHVVTSKALSFVLKAR